jgi:hypothetical protein
MKTELNPEDRERIEKEIKKLRNKWGGFMPADQLLYKMAEYENKYQREQQKELRNKVIEDAVELLATNEYFRQNLFEVNLIKQLLNSLKTKP